MRIGTRIAIGFISALIVVVVLGGMAWRGTSDAHLAVGFIVAFMAGVVVLALAAVLIVTLSITKPLRALARNARALIEDAPDAFFLADLDGRFTDVNAAACALLGYRRDELIGKTIADIIPPEDVPRLAATKDRLLTPGAVEVAEWTQRSRDGVLIPVEVSSTILAGGRWQAFVRDIRERKRAEEALQRSEREFRSLAESMPQIVWATGADGLNTYFNKQWVDYTGLTLEESYDEGWIIPFHPDDRQRAWDAWQRATRHRDTYSLECRLRRADGVYRWWLIRGVPLIDANGEISKWFGTCTDIEQIKSTEQMLKESEAKFSGIISTSPDAIISVDDEQRITIFNEGAEKIFGYSKDEALGAPLDMLIPERFRSVSAGSEGNRRASIAGRRKNGEEFPAEAMISKLKVGDKTLLTVALRDITERKRIEKELMDSNASLDAIIDNIPMMLFIKESQSLRFVRFNRAGEELLGWPKTSLVGKNDYDFWPKDQADFFVDKDRETLSRGTVVDITEEKIQTHHQGVRILHTKKVPILDAAGNPIYLLGISDDITERKRAEKEQQFLAEAGAVLGASLDYEQTLATVAQLVVRDFADWCIVEIRAEDQQRRRLKVVSADPAQAALCAYLEQVPVDGDRPHLLRSVIEMRKPVLIEHVSAEHLESLRRGRSTFERFEPSIPCRSWRCRSWRHGELLGTLAFISSTPSRLYGERDLRLAEALVDRTAVAIENARLYRAAVQATQLRDQVLGVVAHDLRNPLSAIMMQATALQRRGPDPERRSQTPREIIHRAAKRMLRLIQDLLDVARMEQGALSIKRARLGWVS